MKSRLYKCWFNDDSRAQYQEYVATSPEIAAEYFAEDNVDPGYFDSEILVDVEAEDGTVYTVTVEVQVRPTFRAKN